MNIRKNRIETSPKLMIIPMIDVIFFLLVFFMYSSLQMTQQQSLPVHLPQAAAARTEAQKPLAVTILADGKIGFDGALVEMGEFDKVLKSRLAEKPAEAVILRADREVEHGRVIAVLDVVKAAGVQKLSIAAKGKGA